MKDTKSKIEDSSIRNQKSSIINFQRGFTLIEIAMVLVVIGILLSIGVGMLGTLSKRAKYNEARDIVKSAREAVYGYAVKNGFLPTTDISLTGARALDSWGRALEYRVATALSGSGNACGLATTDITVTECTNADCTASNTKSKLGNYGWEIMGSDLTMDFSGLIVIKFLHGKKTENRIRRRILSRHNKRQS